MSDDVEGIVRTIAAFSKQLDKSGHQPLVVSYKLKPLKLSFLQKLFGIDPNDPCAAARYLLECYDIYEHEAKGLQPYVIDGVIDLEKYDYQLGCYDKATERKS